MRIGEDAAHGCVREQREHGGGGEEAELTGCGAPERQREDDQEQRHREIGNGHVQPVDCGETKLSLLLARRQHRRHHRWRESLDDGVGVPDLVVVAFAGAHREQLPDRGDGRSLELPQGIGGKALEHDRAHLLVQALEAAELVEHALAPEELVSVVRQVRAMVAKAQARIGAMVGEKARDDAVLQHPPERQPDPARRPGDLSGDDEVRGEQQEGGQHHRGDTAGKSGERHDAAAKQRGDGGAEDERELDGERGAVGRAGEGGEHDERQSLPGRERLGAQDHEIEREHAETGEDVGEQDTRDPREGRHDRQRGDRAEQDQRPAPQAMGAQDQRDHPDGERRLHDHRGPEIGTRQRVQEQSIDGRAAHLERALVPARDVSAGVIFQQREAVPQRGRKQDEHRRDRGGAIG